MATVTKVPKTPMAAQEEKKKDALDFAIDLLSPTYHFAVDNFRDLFERMLKVELASWAAAIVLGCVITAVTIVLMFLFGMLPLGGMGLVDKLLSNPMALGVIAVWLLLALFAMAWVSKSFSAVSYVIAKEKYEGKYSGIMATFNRIKSPMLSYLLLSFAIVVVGLGLPLALLYFTIGHSLAFAVGLMVYLLYIFVFLVIYFFFTQFWIWELLIAGKGVTESLSGSVSLAKDNLIGVFVYDVIGAVGAIIVGIPFFIVNFGLVIAFDIVSVGTIMVSMLAYLGATVLYVILRLALILIQSAAIESFILPYQYSFWNSIRKK